MPSDSGLEALLAGAENLPSLPAVALEVLRLCRLEDSTLDDLARTLANDPALAARILRFANSSLYSSGEEVRTLQRATLLLGLKTVQLMALSFSLVTAVPREGSSAGFDYRRYWRRSLVRAVAARALAGALGLANQDEAFLVGLLAEIGRVVWVRSAPERYEPLLCAAEKASASWPELEQERAALGFDHAQLGGALLARWQLPRLLVLAVEHADGDEELSPQENAEARGLVRVVRLASRTTNLFTHGGGGRALEELRARAASWFGMTAEALEKTLAELEVPLREATALLELAGDTGPSPTEILAAAHDELVQRSLGQARELHSLRTAFGGVSASSLLAREEHTGCATPAAFQHALEHHVNARADGNLARTLGLVLIELEGLAALPTPAAEQEAERELAHALLLLCRKDDLAARLSPGRFALLLSDASPFGLRAVASRLRASTRLSFGLGAAALGQVRTRSDGIALVKLVEGLLRKACARGPNQSEVHALPLKGEGAR
jgi:HD-like signal output (HDOD) protein/GGDEF domain-containing protein